MSDTAAFAFTAMAISASASLSVAVVMTRRSRRATLALAAFTASAELADMEPKRLTDDQAEAVMHSPQFNPVTDGPRFSANGHR